MNQHQSESEIRAQKVHQLRDSGVNPYPAETNRSARIQDITERFDTYMKDQSEFTITGRLRLFREHGKIAFAQIEDESGRIQLVFAKETLGDQFAEAIATYDVGDIVEVRGVAFLTKKEEQSVMVHDIAMLSKAVLPLPDKWHGIQDEEARYRKRYVDMIMNPELKDIFRKKSIFWNSIREFLTTEGFLEVETPVLENTAGGADAEPFVTHHNALDIDVYLRISMGELWQKRLMVAGFEKTFEIGRQFRNEGQSPEHLQDYTQMEFYMAYADYTDGMRLVERMYKQVIQSTFGTLQFHIRGFDIDFDQVWEHIDYVTEVRERTGIDIMKASVEEMQAKLDELGVRYDPNDKKGRLMDLLWKQCRKEIAGPAFLVHHPVEVSPLAKRDPDNPELVQRFQVIIAGSELGNGYSELNDPFDQESRFEEQARMREEGDTEAQMHDADFVQALQHAMPPTCGFGLSERVFSFLMDKPIKECVMFPLLRPEQPAEAAATEAGEERTTGPDQSMEQIDPGMTLEEADAWLQEEMKDENLLRHSRATGYLMRAIAEKVGAASPDAWHIAGLLHDIDWEQCEAEDHAIIGSSMCAGRGIHPVIVDAILEHNPHRKDATPPVTTMSKYLYSYEQLTGLIAACTFVRPDKSIHSVKLKSIKKKFKDKSFARGVERDTAKEGEAMTGMPLEEAMQICLEAMQAHAAELQLEGN